VKATPGCIRRGRQGPNDELESTQVVDHLKTSDRAQPTLHTIPNDCCANGSRYNETETCRGAWPSPPTLNDHSLARGPMTQTGYRPEVCLCRDSICPGEHFLLGGELGAALAAPRGQNRTTSAGSHAKTESVYLRAAAVVWLEGSLAHSDISKAQL